MSYVKKQTIVPWDNSNQNSGRIKFIREILRFLDKLNENSIVKNHIGKLCFEENWDDLYEYFTQDLEGIKIRNAWNIQFDVYRSKELAQRIIPYLQGDLIVDGLCGSGKIANKIVESTDKNVICIERNHQKYIANKVKSTLIWLDFYQKLAWPKNVDTLILSTVLHHEMKPENTFKHFLERLKPKRIILVENPIYPEYGKSFQTITDFFYQRGLNNLPDPIPSQHKTNKQWVAFCNQGIQLLRGAKVKKIIVQNPCFKLPAILPPHSIITANIEYEQSY